MFHVKRCLFFIVFHCKYFSMPNHTRYIHRCFQIAKKGLGRTKTNPLVGCVITHNHQIIGEGYHKKYGGAHAEAIAIAEIKNPNLLKDCTLYVSLEPCAHQGKQPPCVDLILQKKIPRVIIGSLDINPQTHGKSIQKLRTRGVSVTLIESPQIQEISESLNKRFHTNILQKRPYLILKYAQSADGFIAPKNTQGIHRISCKAAHNYVHMMRSTEDACLIGARTALGDDPQLNLRYWSGEGLKKIVLCGNTRFPKKLRLQTSSPQDAHFFHSNTPPKSEPGTFHHKIAPNTWSQTLFETALKHDIGSIIIEGGSITLQHFIEKNTWDELCVFKSPKKLITGVEAPKINGTPKRISSVDGHDLLFQYKNEYSIPT